jgi:CRISPR-associated protein Csm4
MKTYILPLKQKSGLLSELQSDTIYGHFCWRLKERHGVGKLTEFISLYKNGKPVFILSDGLLQVNGEIRFPRPYIFSKPEIKETKEEKVLEFVKSKLNKERNYLTIGELNDFLKSGKVEIEEMSELVNSKDERKKKRPITSEALRVSVQIDRSSFGSSEGRLFSYNPKYTREDVSYVVLIKVIDELAYKSYDCEDIIKDLFQLGFGKKKSSGYGQFEVGDLSEFAELKEPEKSNAFIVLGNYLPSKSDSITPLGYDINTKYGKFGEELSLSENPFKNPIIFFKAGSCFKTLSQTNIYGRITEEKEISQVNNFAVQFGMPFTLNFNFVP